METRTPFYQVTMGDRTVALGGEDITPWVSAVSVTEDDRQADSVTLTIPDPRMIYADALFEGSWVEVDMGYAEANRHALLIRAVITKVELSYPENGVPTLTLKGEDKTILMGLKEKKRVWRDRTVTSVVREIGLTNGFASVVAALLPDPLLRTPLVQDGKTDLAFLQELAEKYHARCFAELDEAGDEVLYFIPERRVVTLRRPDKLLLSYRAGPGSNLISFSPSFDSSYLDRLKELADVDEQGQTVRSRKQPPPEVFLWRLDPARMAQANARDTARIQRLYARGVMGKAELQLRFAASREVAGEVARDQAEMELAASLLESRRLGMSATGSAFGNIWLRAKSSVQVVGVNERFSGDWYVTSVTHHIDGGGYRTDFKCAR